MALFDLVEGKGVVVTDMVSLCLRFARGRLRGHGDITTVNDLGPAVERVCVKWDIITAAIMDQWFVLG